MIYVLKHIDIEGPGTLEDFLKADGKEYKVLDLYDNASCLKGLSDVSCVVSLGGPMNVYEDDKYPFIAEEVLFIKKMIEEKKPILGICLGAQLIARACGAAVRKADKKEMGWFKASLTVDGAKDALFKSIEKEFDVFQWHEDTFDIPEGASLIAVSETCRNQAFRIGESVYGLQFHIEMGKELLQSWINEYIDINERFGYMRVFLNGYESKNDAYGRAARSIYKNFFG